MGHARVIDENTVPAIARQFLQGQRNEVAESALWQCVLVGKETIVGVEADLRPALHRLREHERSELARENRSNGLFEEEPHVGALTGTRPFDGRRQIQPPAGLHERTRILAPAPLVEIDREKRTRLIAEHGIDSRDERLPFIVASRQMPADHVIGNGQETLVMTRGASDPRLLTDPSHPFVATSRRISGLSGFPALEPARIDIVASAKEGTEQRDLRVCGGVEIESHGSSCES
ncbi:MAG TPA: hypothetical protein VGD79_12715 [Thermoanaerobaculia bacterium]